MYKIALSIITVALVIGLGVIFFGGSQNDTETASTQPGQNIEIKDGVQYITIDAKGGYSPRASSAQADIPTKLIVKTNGTYDCSAALVIRSIGYQKILPQTVECRRRAHRSTGMTGLCLLDSIDGKRAKRIDA